MRKSYLLVLLLCLLISLAVNSFAQMPTSLVPGSKTVLVDSRVVTHPDDWTYLRYRSFQDGIFYEPITGNLFAAYRQWDEILDGSYIRAAISTDGGDNWTTYTELNLGLPNSTGLDVSHDCTIWGLSTTPIVAYLNRAHNDANIQRQPTILFDLGGWNGGSWFNIYIDEKSDPDTICDYRYVDLIVAPDDPNLWLVSAWHSSSSSDPPGEQLVVYRSTDGGYTWSRPKCPISATSADQGQPRAFYNIMSTGLLLDMGMGGKVFAAGEIQVEDMDWYQLVYVTSDDGGQTWSDPAVVPGTEGMSNNVNWNYLNKTSIVDLAGNWHLFQAVVDTTDTSIVNPEEDLPSSGVRYIIDCIFDGTTWDIKEIARPQATHIFGNGLTRQGREHISTPAIDADGTIYYWYMDLVDTTGGYYYESYVKFSEDNGATWQGPVHVANNFNHLYYSADMARVASDNLHIIFDWLNTTGDTTVEHYYMAVPTAEIKNMVSVSEGSGATTPESYQLYQNYPNPFNPTTMIRFDLKEPAHVTLKIFNELGQEVETLLDKSMPAGFKAVSWNATGYPSGVYFYQLKAGNYSATKKMVLAR